MRIRIALAMLFLLLATKATAPEIRSLVIFESRPVDIYERLIRAVVQVESSGDTMAFNAFEEAYGPFQIRPIRLIDYNKRAGTNYKMKDCYTMKVSREVFLYYAKRIGSDFETIAKRWNGSGKKTIEYWAKVKARLEEEEKRFEKPRSGIKLPS